MTSYSATVEIDYTNHRGERAKRFIRPQRIWFGATEWHPKPEWTLTAHDLEKDVIREFAMDKIHSWRAADGDGR